ncbi:MAG: MFS transporter [Gammaproteobacteria bacterium]|nr:MFS transporter [Gammaproteobacteria bacterium]
MAGMLENTIKKIIGIRSNEVKASILAFTYFFCVFSAYYILRPIREEMGLAGGVRNLPWLFIGTLFATLILAPLFGTLVSRYKRSQFITISYRFFAINLIVFYLLMLYSSVEMDVVLGRVFYIWLSAFNLFVVSVFWSFVADGFGYERSRRLFAFLAAGGTTGAIVGASITSGLVEVFGRLHLMLFSVVLIELAVWIVRALNKEFEQYKDEDKLPEAPIGEKQSIIKQMSAGISLTIRSPYLLGISSYLLLYSFLSTFLYFEQANIINSALESRVQRTALFAQIDLWVNSLTLLMQIFLTGHLMRKLSITLVLIIVPILTVAGFISLAFAPVLVTLVIFQVVRRAGSYALSRPARETLFTILGHEEKYKAKNFIDTFVYRSGDALSAGLNGLLAMIGLGVGSVAWVAVPFAVLWTAVGGWLGHKQNELLDQTNAKESN